MANRRAGWLWAELVCSALVSREQYTRAAARMIGLWRTGPGRGIHTNPAHADTERRLTIEATIQL
jgi:hypothetical protein